MYRKLTAIAFPLALLTACGEDAEPEPRLLFAQEEVAPSDDCPNGGLRISSGLDVNRDGDLEESEITATELLCEGEVGDPGEPGFDALARTSVEMPGENCAEGGLRIESGFDEDRNGQLDDEEVDQTTFVCDQPAGEDGRDYLVETSTIEQGECDTASGVIIESGLDDDRDGELDDEEVDDTQTVCGGQRGIDVRVEIETEPPGNNCNGGGQRLIRGLDGNRNGTLEPSEIDDVTFVCDPLASLVRTSSVAAGMDCPAGGTRVERGVDTDASGTLDEREIEETVFLCNGPNGRPNLVVTSTVGPGDDCVNGGVRLESGLDANRDGTLQPEEVDVTTFACNGQRGADGRNGSAVRVTDEPAGANCPSGGTRIEVGPDVDADGQLDDDEVNSTRFLCDGQATQTLVAITPEPIGNNCLNGGERIDTGVDTDMDGVLQADEVTATTYVCNNANRLPIALLTTRDLGEVVKDEPFSATVEATGGLGSYSWSLAPASQLPPGMSLDASGTPDTEISGTGTSTGTFVFDVIVTDFLGAVAQETFEIRVLPPPCEPGVGGLPGTTATTVATSTSISSSSYAVEADDDAAGFLYINATDDIIRIAKDGSTADDVEALAGVTPDAFRGYELQFDDDDVYVIPSAATGTVGRVKRISTDGGATFISEDVLDFTPTGAPDDLRGLAVDGTTMYVISHEDDCVIYEADLVGPRPVTASIFATLTGYIDCSGMAVDADYIYTTAGGTPSDSIEDAVIRVDRFSPSTVDELFADFLTFNLDDSGYNDIELQDGDGDGVSDVLWASGDGGDRRYICTPSQVSTSFFTQPFGSSVGGDNGLAIDPALNALWLYSETADDLFRLE